MKFETECIHAGQVRASSAERRVIYDAFIDRLPVHLELLDTIGGVLFSFGVAVVATLHPSRAAARLTPVEAIRHE